MNLPGFTADSAVGASHKQYRMSPSFRGPVGVMPQWGTDPCYDGAVYFIAKQ
jgi:hypothetical protein